MSGIKGDRMGRDMRTDPQLAVVTRYDAEFGERFLRELAARGVRPVLVCVSHTPLVARWRMLEHLAGHIGWTDALRYNLRFWKPLLMRGLSGGHWSPTPRFDALAEETVHASHINTPEVVGALRRHGITKVILAQSGIVRKPILDLGLWVVNCHPGLLPDYRGVDVVHWALVERGPLGVTLHLVDAGIDTGRILDQRPIPVKYDDTPESIADRSIDISLDMLVEAALRGPSGYRLPKAQDVNKGRQYYLMPFAIARRLRREWGGIVEHYARQAG